MPEAIPASLRQLRAPYLNEYFGAWCIHVDTFRATVERLRGMDLAAHVAAQRARPDQDRNDNLRQRQHPDEPQAQANGDATRYAYTTVQNGIATVDISGSLMKQASSMDDSSSTVALRRTMRALRTDDNVSRVMLRFDSPGGSAAGTQDLSDDIAALSADKPCFAYAEDLCCSAAYWAASQCRQVFTNRTGIVGSIGTYAVLYDLSQAAAMEGVKVHVIAAQPDPASPPAPLKGAGAPGSVITPAQLAEWQQLVNALNNQFLAAVSGGRKMPAGKVAKLADGGVHVGAAAKSAGLVDDVCSFDEAMSRLQAAPSGPIQPPIAPKKARAVAGDRVLVRTRSGKIRSATLISAGTASLESFGQILPPSTSPAPARADAPAIPPPSAAAEAPTSASNQGDQAMPDAIPASAPAAGASKPAANEPKPASIAELKAAFPSHPAFALDSAEKALTMTEAKAAFADVLAKENADLRTQAAQGAQPPPKKPGVAAIKTGTGETRVAASGKHDFETLVEAKIAAGLTRDRAVMKAAAENPELHEDYREHCKEQAKNRRR